jgi:RNA 3'-terminal phosphate cyclase (ATP)
MIEIDGSYGEGGGQILRTSLALSLVTGKSFHIADIRSARSKPGLQQQHLTAVKAAAALGQATLEGAALRSTELWFHPGQVQPGEHAFAVGTAGSAILVLQTVLPALLMLDKPSSVTVEGGTHNPFAPPYDFLEKTFLPLLREMGFKVSAKLQQHGFYPAGGGKVVVDVQPAEEMKRFELLERGEIRLHRARAVIARLPRHIAERELRVIAKELGWEEKFLEVEEITKSRGPGNAVLVEIASRKITEVFAAFGELGVKAEAIADQVVRETRKYLKSEAPVGEHLADQLIIPLALARGGAYRTMPLTAHTTTNIDVVKKFLNVEITASAESPLTHFVEVKPAPA